MIFVHPHIFYRYFHNLTFIIPSFFIGTFAYLHILKFPKKLYLRKNGNYI